MRFPDGPPVFIAHGVPRSPWIGIGRLATDAEIAEHLRDVAEPLVVVAHTHLTMDRRVERWRVLNPGSVGNPLDGIPTASYLLLESRPDDWQAAFRRVPYDREALFRAYARQGFVEACGVVGYLAVEEMKTARPEITPFLRWHEAACPERPLAMDLLTDYATIDRWEYRGPSHRVNLHQEGPGDSVGADLSP